MIDGFDFDTRDGVILVYPRRIRPDDGSDAPQPLIHVHDHKDRARRDLLSQFQTKPRIVALVTGLAAGAQAMEDTLFDMATSRTLPSATGATLDQLGALVGQSRNGMEDRDYRRFILARTLANRCRCTADELIEIFELATDADRVVAEELHPMTIRFTAYRRTWMDDRVSRATRRIMSDVKRLGLSLVLIEALSEPFGFGAGALGFGAGQFSRIIR